MPAALTTMCRARMQDIEASTAPVPEMERHHGSRFLHNLDDVVGDAAALRPLLLRVSMLMPAVSARPTPLKPRRALANLAW